MHGVDNSFTLHTSRISPASRSPTGEPLLKAFCLCFRTCRDAWALFLARLNRPVKMKQELNYSCIHIYIFSLSLTLLFLHRPALSFLHSPSFT